MAVIVKGKYTQVPNVFLNIIPMLDLPCVAKDILWMVIRATYGFHKGWIALHTTEIARTLGCNTAKAWGWVARLVRWGVIVRAKCSLMSTRRKRKPRYVYAINPDVSKWAVFRRKRFYRREQNKAFTDEAIWELGDKYNEMFHSPPDTEIYKQMKELIHYQSPKRIIGLMKKSVKCGESWTELLERLLPSDAIGGTD